MTKTKPNSSRWNKNPYRFEDKTALITGGSSGIGLAIAKRLAAQGARVWLLARGEEKLKAAAQSVKNSRVLIADVSNWEQVQSAVQRVINEDGAIDLLINSAGVARPGYVQELSLDIFREMIEINYLGTVHIVKAALPNLIERRSGHIVNICSTVGFLGVFGYTAYGASKYAVRGFSDALRTELKRFGVGVSIVFPPDTDTPQLAFENQFKPKETKALAGNAGMLSADQVAEAVLDGVQRGRYVILPGFENKFLYRLSGLLGNLVYPIMDWLIARDISTAL